MKEFMKVMIVYVVFPAWIGFGADSVDNEMRDWEKGQQERMMSRELARAVVSWLADANEAAGVESDRLTDSLLQLAEPSARAYFMAAQAARLRGKPDKAIQILEMAVAKYPEEKAPIGLVVPVKIVGRLWIASIAKQSSNLAKAKSVYETLLKDVTGVEGREGLMLSCNLYLVEIEFDKLKDTPRALARLEAIARVKTPEGAKGTTCAFYKAQAAYTSARISKGSGWTTDQVMAVSDAKLAPLLAVTELTLSGITGEPLVGSVKGTNIVAETLVNRTIAAGASRIEMDLARLGYGFDQQYKKDFAKAEKYYSALFQDESFFSPLAGIHLAMCKKDQGRVDEANKILDEVVAKYPGCKQLVSELRQ